MATVFWDMKGILLIDWLPEGSTVNAQYYCGVLERLREKIKSERRGMINRGIVLQHDNARPHTCNATLDTIQRLGFDLLPHHDLPFQTWLPSDYWLPSKMKELLRGRFYANLSVLRSAINQWVWDTPHGILCPGSQKAARQVDQVRTAQGQLC